MKSSSDQTIEDYEVGKLLGRGAYGTVNLATKKSDGSVVAIKTVLMKQVLEIGKAQHVLREKDILNKLKHPNVI